MNAQTKDRDRQTRQVIRDAIARSHDEEGAVEVQLPGGDVAEVISDIARESTDCEYEHMDEETLDVWGTTLDGETPYHLIVFWKPHAPARISEQEGQVRITVTLP